MKLNRPDRRWTRWIINEVSSRRRPTRVLLFHIDDASANNGIEIKIIELLDRSRSLNSETGQSRPVFSDETFPAFRRCRCNSLHIGKLFVGQFQPPTTFRLFTLYKLRRFHSSPALFSPSSFSSFLEAAAASGDFLV